MSRKKPKLLQFGLHKDEELDTWWLVQQEDVVSAVGLPKTEFRYKPPTFYCPHSIKLEESELSQQFKKDMRGMFRYPMFRAMCPIPNISALKGHYIITDKMQDLAAAIVLQKMFSPNRTCGMSINMARVCARDISRHLNSSNIASQLISGITPYNMHNLMTFAPMSIGCVGNLFFIGEKIPQYNYNGILNFITPNDEFTKRILKYKDTDDFNKLGANMLIRFMRGEDWQTL